MSITVSTTIERIDRMQSDTYGNPRYRLFFRGDAGQLLDGVLSGSQAYAVTDGWEDAQAYITYKPLKRFIIIEDVDLIT